MKRTGTVSRAEALALAAVAVGAVGAGALGAGALSAGRVFLYYKISVDYNKKKEEK